MPVDLAGIQLKRIHKIATQEQAAFVYHRIPGLEGAVAQDLGRASVRLQIEGIFYGAEAVADMEELRKVYQQRRPVDFLADIVGRAYFGQVILDSFEVFQLARDPDQFSYTLTLVEYVAPPQPTTATASVDAAIQADAQAFMDVATLPDALQTGSIPEITDPTTPLTGAVSQMQAVTGELDQVTQGIAGLFGPSEAPPPEPPPLELPDDWGKPAPLTWPQQ